jgi:hypothetical protein
LIVLTFLLRFIDDIVIDLLVGHCGFLAIIIMEVEVVDVEVATAASLYKNRGYKSWLKTYQSKKCFFSFSS